MVDASASAAEGNAGVDEEAWLDPRRATDSLFPERDPSQVAHMRSSLFDSEERDEAGSVSGTRATDGVAGEARASSTQQPSAWLPLLPPLLPPRPALGNPEDAEAAAMFRPIVAGPQSHVLRLLANAWKPTPGEVADEGTRGVVRAGQTVGDLGLRFGRGFRASWGPGGQLVCPGASGGGGVAGCHSVRILRFDPTPAASGRGTEELYVAPLRNHLRFARPTSEVAGRIASAPPRWALPRRSSDHPDGYAALVRCMHGYTAAHASAGDASEGRRDTAGEDSPEWVLEQSWRLISAMWGQEEGEGRAQDLPVPGDVRAADVSLIGGCDGASPAARREAAVGTWLANAVASCVPAKGTFLGGGAANSCRPGGAEETCRRVLELLSVHRVEEAANTAMAAGLPRLAVVLTAAATEGVVGWPVGRHASNFLAQQATLWQGGGADARMPLEAFSIYQLLGREGFRDVRLNGMIGKGSDSLYPSLDWLRQLGLCLWFGAGAPAGGGGGGVAEAVEVYESLVAEEEALPPTARYFREPTHHDKADLDQVCDELHRVHVGPGGSSEGGAASGRDRCVLSRLLAMYPSRNPGGGGGGGGASGVALLAALEPMAVTPDVMDYRHSWHVMSVVEALGVAKVPDRAKAAAVAEGLRFQLVAAGLWEWAVYVTLTTEGDPDRREATARELVVRHGHRLLGAPFRSTDAARRDLLEELGVPMAWLHEAAAVRAG